MSGGQGNMIETDADLSRRLRGGDGDAFRLLYERHAPQLLAFLMSRCRRKHQATDIAQDVWLRVWSARERFDGSQFRGWLFQIARNRLIDAYRRTEEGSLGDDFDPQAHGAPDENERLAALRDCLDQVGGEFVDVVRAVLDGADVPQVAARLGIQPATVYTRVNRGKAQLRDCVEHKLA